MLPEMAEKKIKSGGVQSTPPAAQSPPAELDIQKELEELYSSPDWQRGMARKVLIRYPDFQLTLRAMKANTRIPEHHNPGRIFVQTVCGHIRMHAGGRLFDLPEGKALVLDRAVMHDVEALEDSAFLLTVALPQGSES